MVITENYHTHTYRCKHADGDVDDYCRAAIKNGLKVLGITDHTPFDDNKWLSIRMDIAELDDYCKSIDDAKVRFPDLKILKGMECEYRAESIEFFKNELLRKRNFDYLVLGSHFFPFNGEYVCSFGGPVDEETLWAYTNHIIEAMRTEIFAFVAHPDVFGNSYIEWDEICIACSKKIISTAVELDIPLEINGCGIRKGKKLFGEQYRYQYPLNEFWELASQYDVRVVINSDAHIPNDIVDCMQECYDIAQNYNLTIADMSYLEKR